MVPEPVTPAYAGPRRMLRQWFREGAGPWDHAHLALYALESGGWMVGWVREGWILRPPADEADALELAADLRERRGEGWVDVPLRADPTRMAS